MSEIKIKSPFRQCFSCPLFWDAVKTGTETRIERKQGEFYPTYLRVDCRIVHPISGDVRAEAGSNGMYVNDNGIGKEGYSRVVKSEPPKFCPQLKLNH